MEPPVPGKPNLISEPPEIERELPKVKNKFIMTKHSNKFSESISMFERVRSAGNWVDIVKKNAPVYLNTGL